METDASSAAAPTNSVLIQLRNLMRSSEGMPIISVITMIGCGYEIR